MARDYKGQGGKRRRSSNTGKPSSRRASTARRGAKASGGSGSRRGSRQPSAPGWQWMLAGLAIGLFVAVAVFVYDRLPGIGPAARNPGAALDTPVPAPTDVTDDVALADTPATPREPRYEFYDLLTRYEVVIAEEQAGVADPPPAVEEPGTYVLQAGSFRSHADADRRQAMLALQGIESRIQVVTIDSDAPWHRVRIGPVDDLRELDRLRERLRGADIEFLVLRVGGR
jgi:hypothetical protein